MITNIRFYSHRFVRLVRHQFMNKCIITILLILLTLIIPRPVSAHILKTDGSIGGILHIDPEDDPISRQPTNMFWDFTNHGQKFEIKDCICSVSILENGKEIEKEQLVTDTFTYTFPKKDVYQINVSGSSKNSSFQPFILSYDIRVERESTTLQPTTEFHLSFWEMYGGIIMFGAFVCGCIFLLVLYLKHERR